MRITVHNYPHFVSAGSKIKHRLKPKIDPNQDKKKNVPEELGEELTWTVISSIENKQSGGYTLTLETENKPRRRRH